MIDREGNMATLTAEGRLLCFCASLLCLIPMFYTLFAHVGFLSQARSFFSWPARPVYI